MTDKIQVVFTEDGFDSMTDQKVYEVVQISFGVDPSNEYTGHFFLVVDDNGSYVTLPEFFFRKITALEKVL